jgi:adenosylcobinamide kinase/adenosylcobinamide-phosphate guanylyltransferase
MDVRFLGTGGPAGWPQPGCRCASCMRATAAGLVRRPGAVLVDGRLRIDPGRPLRPAVSGYLIEPVPGGWDITGPDGARLLAASGPGAVPGPRPETRPFDLALLDLLDSPAQLGALRERRLVGPETTVAALCADHRISSEQELARRCAFWRAVPPGDGDTLSAGPGAGLTMASPGLLPHRTLLLGGTRSGKSREAEMRLAAEPQVTYVAAGPWPDGTRADGTRAGDGPDAEWAQRVAAHRAARPARWPTLETTDVAGALRRLRGAVLIDGIGTWLAAAMTEAGAWQAADARTADAQTVDAQTVDAQTAGRIAGRVDELVAAWRETSARVVAVSDQVGSGVVPATPAGRQFADQLGWLNQRLAAESELAALVVAGHVLSLPT